jgi:eukaryotic-like serine/threonine-protein kinase
MDNSRWQRIQTLFHEALQLPQEEQAAFLKNACNSDRDLLAEVLTMLHEDRRGTSLLDRGLPDMAQRIIGTTFEAIKLREFGPYRLKEVLGEGGMGVVWLAERVDTEQLLAIKFLPHAGLSPTRRERFTREIKTLAKLKYPYIARLYDAGTLDDGTPWFVMELVQGVRFTAYCRSQPRTVEELLWLFRKVCEAVQYAHGQEIIHRDLKPSNILVEQDGTPRLLDFGIARELQNAEQPADQTRPELRFMSPDYAAPEWVGAGTVGFFTDVYSLGIMLYEVLTGKLPAKHIGADAEKPSAAGRSFLSLSTGAWNDLDVLCLKAMHKDVQQRYPSVEALIRDIDHYLRNEPLEGRPDSLPYRVSKFARRNRRPVLAASLALAIVAGLIFFFTLRVTKARNAALKEAARTQRIQRLLLNLLGAEDSSAAPSNELRVVTLLDRWSKQVAFLDTDPETQAELYETLGTMYSRLADFPKANELLQAGLARMKKTLPPDSPQISKALVLIGLLRGDQAQYVEAQRFVQEGLRLALLHLPSDDLVVLHAQSALARVLLQGGEYAKAIAILEPIVQGRPPVGEEGTHLLAESAAELSIAQYYLGHFKTSEELARRTVALDRQLYGKLHPQTGNDLMNLGSAQFALFEYSQAESTYRESIEISKAWYGADHPDVATAMSILGRLLVMEGKQAEAKAILEHVLKIQERAYGRVHDRIAVTLDGLGTIAEKNGDLAAAEADFSRAVDIDKALLGLKNTRTASLRANLANVYVREGRYIQAEEIFRDALKVLAANLPPGDAHIGLAEIGWGRSLLRLKRFAEAEGPLTAGYTVMEKQTRPSLVELQAARRDLADVYAALHQPEKAREFRGPLATAK